MPELGFPAELARRANGCRKGERTRIAIRQALCRCLDAAAPMDVTVADICAAAGIAHGTFYIYYSDRNALIGDVALRFIAHLQDEMHGASRADPGDPMRAATAAYVALFEQNRGLMRCLIHHLDGFAEAKAAFQRLNREWLDSVVAAALRRHGPHADRDELMRRAYALGGMTDQYLAGLLLSEDPNMRPFSDDREAVIDTLNLLWRLGMAP